jgi:hypothetical protein
MLMQVDETPSVQPRSNTYSSRRNRKRSPDPVDKELLEILKQSRSSTDQDEHHHYGLSVGSQLRKLAPAKAAIARLKIERVLYEVQYGREALLREESEADSSPIHYDY